MPSFLTTERKVLKIIFTYHRSNSIFSGQVILFAPPVGLTVEEYLRRTYEQQVSQFKAEYKDFEGVQRRNDKGF